MMVSRFRWGLRVGLMFFAGVVPVIMLLVLLLVILPLAAVIPDMLWFVAAIGFLGVIGVVGLWGATFRDEQESVLGNAVTIPCLLVGLLPAVLYFLGMVRDSIEDEFLSLVAILLIGPIACAFYFLIEQVAHRLAAIPERLTTAWSATRQSRAPQAER